MFRVNFGTNFGKKRGPDFVKFRVAKCKTFLFESDFRGYNGLLQRVQH